MAQTKTITHAVERIGHRVTIGDVAAEAGIPLMEAQRGVLALATETQAHLQVAESGEIAYVFPKNIQAVLWSKSWRLRLQSTWEKVWRILFYLIRISFGVMLILSLVLIVVAITVLAIAASSAGRDDNNGGGGGGRGGGGMIFLPRMWLGPDIFWMFDPRGDRRRPARAKSELNFLEAVYSFLFGDGDPNADLDERRWQNVAQVIQANGGAVVAEQITPFLGDLGKGWASDLEDYMVPVLSRFNGLPQVSPQGNIVYQFPELQVTAKERRTIKPPQFLRELPRRFSQATSGQIMTAVGLGGANLVGALALGSMLQDNAALVAELGGIVALVNSLYWLLLGYGAAFLSIPLVRYFWVQRQNSRIEARNAEREQRVAALKQSTDDLQEKLAFAETLSSQTVLGTDDLAYTTEADLTEQEAAQKDKIDSEWQRLLEERQGGK
jgi:cell division protein FtsB